MTKPAAMPVFGDAYIADTRHLTLEEHGAYWLLLLIAWRAEDCALPNDDKRIAQMLGITAAKWSKLKPTIMAFWTLGDGRWTQKRLTKERKFLSEKREKNSQAAQARWNGQVTENKRSAGNKRISERTSERICQNDAPPPLRTLKGSNTRARTFPDDWTPEAFSEGSEASSIMDGWADGERDRQFERFRDHHRAKGTRFADWQAAWGTWVRNSVRFAAQRPANNGGSDYGLADRVLEEHERRKRIEQRDRADLA